MKLKEDWNKLPTWGKFALVGGGGLALYLLYRAYASSSSSTSTAAQPVVSTPSTSSSGSTGSTGAVVGSGTSGGGNSAALEQLAMGQAQLAQLMATNNQQLTQSFQSQLSTENGQFLAALNSQNQSMNTLLAKDAQQQQALAASEQQMQSTIVSQGQQITSLTSLLTQLQNQSKTSAASTQSATNHANTGTGAAPTVHWTPPAASTVTMSNVNTGVQSTVPVVHTTTGVSVTVPGGNGLRVNGASGSYTPPSTSGILSDVGAGNAGLPAGEHKVAVPVNFAPGQNHKPEYRIA